MTAKAGDYRYKLLFQNGSVRYFYDRTRATDDDFLQAYVVIDLWANTYVKNRLGRTDVPVAASNDYREHMGGYNFG